MTGTRNNATWRRIFHWPLFVVLAVLHIGVLPLLLSERQDDVLSLCAGVAYLALAVADLRYPAGSEPAPGPPLTPHHVARRRTRAAADTSR